jgi:hypothetical protein
MKFGFIGTTILACACGGASAAHDESTKSANSATGDKTDDSIADVASREGLPSLGGAGVQRGSASGSLHLELVDKEDPIKLDGTVKEWTLVPARTVVKGSEGSLGFRCGLAYDSQYVYFAGEVVGVTLRHLRRFVDDEDHATLVVAAPNSPPIELSFFAGKPGESAGVVRAHVHGLGDTWRDVPGAKIIEAENDKGYTFEAQIPWSAVAPPTIRVGLRGVASFHAPASGGTRTILATGNGDAQSPSDMPALPTQSEEALIENFLVPKGLLATAPKFELLADIRGDAMKERVAVYDRFLTVVGPNYRDGREFFYRDLGSDVSKIEARDLTGRGKADLVLRRQFPDSGDAGAREWIEVWSFLSDEPTTVFSHEISVASGANRVTNAVHLASREIDVTYDPAVGFDAATYRLPHATDTEPVLLPWGPIKSQTFRFDGSKFTKAREVTQASTAPATTTTTMVATATTSQAITRVEPPTPQQRPGGDLSGQLLARYRADRGVADSVRPRVDVQVHVDGDARPERVLLVGRDVVVFGPGFKNGTSYAYLTLSQFASDGDVEDMTTRDVTGDGAADIIVRGVRHVGTSNSGTIDMHMMFVYQLRSEVITRVFGIETARAQGTKRIQGLVQWVPAPGNRGFVLDVRPGRAQGWTDHSYPFSQDQPGQGALEPLLLPWGGIDHLRYAFNGTTFARSP